MIRILLDYLGSIAVCGGLGALAAWPFTDPLDGGLIGAVVGFFVGAGVRAWRTRGKPESFYDRDLTGWSDD